MSIRYNKYAIKKTLAFYQINARAFIYNIFKTLFAISSKFPFSNLFISIFSGFSRLSVIKKVLTPNSLTIISSNALFPTIIDSSGFESGVKKMSGLAAKGLAAIGTTLAGASAYAIKVGADFEEGMSKVAAISGTSGKELEALTEIAKEMGAKTKFSATESAEAMQ